MQRIRIVGVVALLALVGAACSDDSGVEQRGRTDSVATTRGREGPLAEFGESTAADPALVEKALGPVTDVPDIVLASIARADQDLDQATIDKALECWNATECDTGTGGDVMMGYADGGGLNVWRQVTRMEAILQALTYPEIGTIVFRDAQWDPDPAVAAGDIEFLIQAGSTSSSATRTRARTSPTRSWRPRTRASRTARTRRDGSACPGQEGALVPGEDYLTVVGEDLCALGESFAEVINDGVGAGKVGLMGGTPGNALSARVAAVLQQALNERDRDARPGRHLLGQRRRAADRERVAVDRPRHQGVRLRVRRRA